MQGFDWLSAKQDEEGRCTLETGRNLRSERSVSVLQTDIQ
jgi:hypothetical protein